jgi:hypothetical protein
MLFHSIILKKLITKLFRERRALFVGDLNHFGFFGEAFLSQNYISQRL